MSGVEYREGESVTPNYREYKRNRPEVHDIYGEPAEVTA